MKRFLSAAMTILLWTSSPLASQEIQVRSGEHGEFTRLVFRVPDGTDWTLTPSQNGAKLAVGLEKAVYVTNDVFDRISRERLQSLSQDKPGAPLEMTFSCDCTAKGFVHQGNMIVVDIAPAAPSAADQPPAPTDETRQKQTADLDLPANLGTPALNPAIEPWLNVSPGSRPTADIENRLLTRILQGTDNDVLDLELATAGPRRSLSVDTSNLFLRTPDLGNIAVGTVLDRTPRDNIALPSLQAQRVACLDDTETDLSSWSDDGPFASQVSSARRELFGEFDRLSRDQALKLAKTYVYFGFGAEAAQVLSLIEPAPKEAKLIRTLALVMDGAEPGDENAFAGMENCDGNAALWAALTQEQLTKDSGTKAIEQAFARLPDHLKGRFGPKLARIMSHADHLEAARRVLRSTKRSGWYARSEFAVAEAELAAAEGDRETEAILLNEVVEAQEAAPEAPLAMARLIEQRWIDRGELTGTELEMAAAFSSEYRHSAIGAKLAQAHVLALALNRNFAEAKKILARHAADSKDPAWMQAHDRYMRLLTERADDITFLASATQLEPKTVDALSSATARAVAERLVSLGFFDSAREIAERLESRKPHSSWPMILASADLSAGQPRKALESIASNDTQETSRLRAKANAAIGDFEAAAKDLLAAQEPEGAARFLWLSERWEAAEQISDETYGVMSRLSRDLVSPVAPDGLPPLAQAHALLDASRQTREEIAELLAAAGHGGN